MDFYSIGEVCRYNCIKAEINITGSAFIILVDKLLKIKCRFI